MDNFWKTLAGIVAGFFASLFVAATALTLMLYNVERRAFDADLYIQALDQENVYVRLPELTARALSAAAQQPGRTDTLSLFRNLPAEQWQAFVLELFPADELRSLVDGAIRQVMAYLNGESTQAVLSLAGLKAHLASPAGIEAISGLFEAQPDCSLEQLTAMAMGQQLLSLCNPPDTFLFVDIRPIFEAEIRTAVSLIPDQVTIASAGVDRVRPLRELNVLRTMVRLSPLVPFVCLLVVTALAVRSLADWLNWWGYPFLAAGILSLMLSVMSRPLAAATFQRFIAPVLPEALPAEIVTIFKDLTARIVHDAVQPSLLIAGLLALAGIGMVGGAFLLEWRTKRAAPLRR